MNKKNWDNVYKEKGIVQKDVVPLLKNSVKLLKKNKIKKILDLGCGTGRHTLFLAKKGFEVYGTDISKKGLEIIKKIIKKESLSNIRLKKGDFSRIPFKNSFFDAIVSISVINHAKTNKIKKTFSEIKRVLRKKGILILYVISPNDFTAKTGREIEKGTRIGIADWDSDIPHHFFTKKELLDYLKDYKILKFKEASCISQRLFRKRWHFEIIAIKN